MNVLMIDGHPAPDRLSTRLLDHFAASLPPGHEVGRIALRDLSFDPVLHDGYATRQPWEPDLLDAARRIDACDHLVLAFPMWWGGEPALVKGFVDRVFLPHFTFRYHDNDPWWDGLLAGRSADLFVTMDTPPLYLRFGYHNAIVHRWRKQIMEFVGFSPVHFHSFGVVRRGGAEKQMTKWLGRVAGAAKAAAGHNRKARQSRLADFLAYRDEGGSSRLESP